MASSAYFLSVFTTFMALVYALSIPET